jgi:putative addiction module killer protein
MKQLKDAIGKAHIDRRIMRLANGDAGDCGPIGEGLSEMRIHNGPGYRVYFKDTGTEIIILLCADDKSTQRGDIEKAKKLAREDDDGNN